MTWKLFFLEIHVSSLSLITPNTDVGHLCSLISAWGVRGGAGQALLVEGAAVWRAVWGRAGVGAIPERWERSAGPLRCSGVAAGRDDRQLTRG